MPFPDVENPQGQDLTAMSACDKAFKFYVLYYLSRMLQTEIDEDAGWIYGSKISESPASINATVIKNSAGKLGHIDGSNTGAEEVYVKIYDKATTPNPAVDVPVYRYLIPGRTTGAGSNVPFPSAGINFTNGIAYIITPGVADTSTTVTPADEVIVNYGYK